MAVFPGAMKLLLMMHIVGWIEGQCLSQNRSGQIVSLLLIAI